MLTRLEQEQAELTVHCLPRIANALESIAKSLTEIHRDFCCTEQFVEHQKKIHELNINEVDDGDNVSQTRDD